MRQKVSGISAGIAVGPVYRYRQTEPVPALKAIGGEQVEEELRRLAQAVERTGARLAALCEKLEAAHSPNAGILRAQQDMLCDAVMLDEARDLIRTELLSAQAAITRVYDKYIDIFSRAPSELIAQRAADLGDLKRRLLLSCTGQDYEGLSELTRPVVLVAEELFPSDTVLLDSELVLGIITQVGGYTSHAAIIARSLEIPAVVWEDALSRLRDGELVAVDAGDEVVVIDPNPQEQAQYRELRRQLREKRERTRRFAQLEPVTADGVRIRLAANIGSTGKTELEGLDHADGVGLFRTEFLYMGRAAAPDEEEQYRMYRKVLETAGERPVTLRTLDIGGDKEVAYLDLPKEKNPFLGLRAIRLCFERPELLRTQLRAALRAGVHGRLEIMFPMVASVEDVKRCLAFTERVKEELAAENMPFARQVPLGVMVEVPALAFVAEAVAELVDFSSIGTNDLCQYLTASDRMNPRLGAYYKLYHPAMFRCIRAVTEAFGAKGKPVSVCGEMGADPAAAMIFVGLGIRKLSMNPASFAGVKQMLAGTIAAQAAKVAERVLAMDSAEEIAAYMNDVASDGNFG